MTDVAIVGAGPAGLAAAATLAQLGVHSTVVDEQQAPGGQIFRQPPTEFGDVAPTASPGYEWGTDLIERCVADERIAWRFGSTAWAVLHEDSPGDDHVTVALQTGHGPSTPLRARRLLIASGAYDLPVAVPGWTLPGVVTAGAVQSMLKSQRLLLGRRFVLAGSHPLLLVVADQLLSAGADVAEVVLSQRAPAPLDLLYGLGAVPGHVTLLRESAAAVRRIRRRGVPIRLGCVVTGVDGDDEVESVQLRSVDRRAAPRGPVRVVECDSLVLGYGFLPSTELARQAGCAVSWVAQAGGWVVSHDQGMRTSVDRIYVAGEPTGVTGAEQSRAEGVVAGLALAVDLGALDGQDGARRVRAAQADLRRARRFSRAVQRTFPPPFEALPGWATAETVICRCELVTAGTVRDFVAANPHVHTANAVKLECRTGMGLCQGRYCQATVTQIIAQERGMSPSAVGTFTAQAPVKPIPLRALVLDPGTKDDSD